MVPPHLKLNTRRVKWTQLDATVEKTYASELASITSALVRKILCYQGAQSINHSRAPLIKVLPLILGDNQVSCSTSVSEAALVHAILADQADEVRVILRHHPEFLQKKLAMPRNYIGCNNSSAISQTFSVMEMIVRKSTMLLDVLLDFSDDAWPEKLNELHLTTIYEVAALLTRFPADVDALPFINKHLDLIRTHADVTQVLGFVPLKKAPDVCSSVYGFDS